LITVGLLSGVQTKRIDAFLPAYLSDVQVIRLPPPFYSPSFPLCTRAILVIASAISSRRLS
jgi:hypothetical protein